MKVICIDFLVIFFYNIVHATAVLELSIHCVPIVRPYISFSTYKITFICKNQNLSFFLYFFIKDAQGCAYNLVENRVHIVLYN